MTVPGMPVGAGTEQSPKTNKLSIAQDDDNCNPLAEVKIFLAEKDKREAGVIPTKPCLSVTNLNDLYSYSFKGTPPIIENFLYPGVQIFAFMRENGKSIDDLKRAFAKRNISEPGGINHVQRREESD